MLHSEKGNPTNAPTTHQIEAALAGFRPLPSQRFYQRMARAPWAVSTHSSERQPLAQALRTRRPSVRLLAASGLAALVLATGLVATPWGRAFAADCLRLFTRTPGNTRPLSQEEIEWAAADPDDLASEEPKPFAYSNLSISELEAELGFDIKEPPALLHDFSLEGAVAYQTGVMFVYRSAYGGRVLYVFQQTAAEATTVLVGADATIEEVQVRGVTGEYVEGMFAITYPGATEATWIFDGSTRRLRWIEDGVLIDIVSGGGSPGHGGYLGKMELIALAESLT